MEEWELLEFLKHESSAQQKENLEKWIALNDDNKNLFEKYKNAWENSGAFSQPLTVDQTKAWLSIQQRIKDEQHKSHVNQPAKKYSPSLIYGIAASLVAAIFALWLFLPRSQKNEMLSVNTANNKLLVTLPDSSRVFLNENSSLVYPKSFNSEKRLVSLIGEAYFEITKKPQQPFVIQNENFNVTVLGTSFDVTAYKKDSSAIVSVVTGRVLLTAKTGAAITLQKNETGILNTVNRQLIKQEKNNLNFLSWKTKKLEFKNSSFREVCEELQHYFSITFDVKNQELYNCSFTGTFTDPSIQEVIRILEKTLNVKTKLIKKHVTFMGAGC
jgi:transmembrane sensor